MEERMKDKMKVIQHGNTSLFKCALRSTKRQFCNIFAKNFKSEFSYNPQMLGSGRETNKIPND